MMFLLVKVCQTRSICINKCLPSIFAITKPVQYSIGWPQPQAHYQQEVEKQISLSNRKFFQKTLKLSDKRIENIFTKYRELDQISHESLLSAYNILKLLPLSYADIKTYPELLLYNRNRLNNHYMILKECGYRQVTAHRLKNYKSIMSQSVRFNKCFNFLPLELNVFETIMQSTPCASINTKPQFVYSESMALRDVYLAAAKIYLKNRLNIRDAEMDRLYQRFPTLKQLSINNIEQSIALLTNEFNFSIKEISKGDLLVANSMTTKTLVEVRRLCGVDVRELVSAVPQLLRTDIGNILRVNQIIIEYGIPEYAVVYYKKIFTMKADALSANLRYLDQMKVSSNVFRLPPILKLVQQLNTIEKHLEAYNRSSKNPILLKSFFEFVLRCNIGLGIQNKFLAHLFECSESEMKTTLAKMTRYRYVPPAQILSSIDFLRSEGFKMEDIFHDISIIFYPSEKIKSALMQINDPTAYAEHGIDMNNTTKSKTLRLCIYLIELKLNFTGNGIQLYDASNKYSDDELIVIREIVLKL